MTWRERLAALAAIVGATLAVSALVAVEVVLMVGVFVVRGVTQ